MNSVRLAPVDLHSIKLDVPLPFIMVDSRGILLAHKGFIFQTEKILEGLANRGSGFFVNFADRSDPQLRITERAYASQLQKSLRSQNPLGDLLKVQVSYANSLIEDADQKPLDWLDLIEGCNAMLHTRDINFFNRRLDSIASILSHQLSTNPDEALLALFYLSERNGRLYSATHGLLVCVICVLTATHVLRWSESDVDLLMRCALTMNIGMVDLQDDLTLQAGPLDMSQKFLIGEHTNLSVHILDMFGVEDKDWLTIVRLHHKTVQEPLQSAHVTDRLIGLINRADVFSAKCSSRRSREALHPALAMKSIYIDAQAKADPMGAAIIKTVGIYRPGSFVKLASGEVGLVIRRDANTTTPAVMVVLNRDGIAVVALSIRDTSDRKYAVISNVPSSMVKVTLNLERILELSRQKEYVAIPGWSLASVHGPANAQIEPTQ